MGFIKAPPGTITRYLWIGGVHGMSVRQLAELFAPYGSPTVVLPEAVPTSPSSPPPPTSLKQRQQQQQQAHEGGENQQLKQQRQQPPGSSPSSADPEDLPPPAASHRMVDGYHAFLAFEGEGDAAAAVAAVPRGVPWAAAGGRRLVLNFADVRRDKRPVPRPACTTCEELGVPGLVLLADFVTEEEERRLVEAVNAVNAAAAEGRSGERAAAASGHGAEAGRWEAMARRRVLHFGYRFDYATRNVDPSAPLGPLPRWAVALADRISALPEVSQPLDQLTVNEYEPGVGLAPHVDTHSAFTGPIISLSLGSSAVMEMRRGEATRPLLLPRRSLLVMGEESRYAWQHYIPHRVADLVGSELLPRGRRLSLTFRKVRGFPCDCAFPDCCDSQHSTLPPTRISQLQPQPQPQPQIQLQPQRQNHQVHSPCEQRAPSPQPPQPPYGQLQHGQPQPSQPQPQLPQHGAAAAGTAYEQEHEEEARLAALEAEYVHRVYDAIAPHFSATRFAIWPRVRAFIESLPAGGVVADVGCGNGKYFGVRRDLAVLGSDISAGLAEVAAQRLAPPGLPPSASPPAADALVADALRLPYRDGSCDGVLCIAVLHHLSSHRRRVRLLRQLLRVLRPAAARASGGGGGGGGAPYGGGGGGRALVTVWATEQEDPAKTTAKWTRITAPDGGGGGANCDSVGPVTAAAVVDDNRRGDTSSSGGGRNGAGDGGGGGVDYFVPWHLPFHRTEAAKAAKVAREAAPAAKTQGCSGCGDGYGADAAAPKIDVAKGAVVFQRYYHLFERRELEGLVAQSLAEGPAGMEEAEDAEAGVGGSSSEDGGDGSGRRSGPCGVIEEVFYDRSNWCIVFRRDR